MSQIYILDDVKIYLFSIVYKTWPDLLHHFSGQPLSTSSLIFNNSFKQVELIEQISTNINWNSNSYLTICCHFENYSSQTFNYG